MENTIAHIPVAENGSIMYTPDRAELSLVNAAKHDRAAFGKLFEKYYEPVYRYVLHRTADVDLAQDLTSETFELVLDKLWTFKWKNVPFSAWLFRVASNVINGYYRKNKKKHQSESPVPENIAADTSDDADYRITENELELEQKKLFLTLHNSIKKLKPKYQEVIVLRYFENKQVSEIAIIAGKSEGTVKSLIHRALAYLEKMIEPGILGESENE